MEKVEITCDYCGKDITVTSETPAFRLKLSAEGLPHTSKGIYTVLVNPPISSDCHFCNLACLAAWLNELKGES